MPDHEIEEIRDRLAENLKPQTIYLFGSYADSTYTDESDFDFYVIVSDDAGNLADLTAKACSSIGYNRSRPADIFIGACGTSEGLSSVIFGMQRDHDARWVGRTAVHLSGVKRRFRQP